MSEEDFISAIAPPTENDKIKRENYTILFRVADRNRHGGLSLQDWEAFQSLLSKPDAKYETGLRLFDRIKPEDFIRVHDDRNGVWARLYLGGKDNCHQMSYPQFTLMARALQGKKFKQALIHYDKNHTGFIESEEFQKIVQRQAKHTLSENLLNNISTLCNMSAGSKISFASVKAFENVFQELDMVLAIIRSATIKSPDGKITKTDFLKEATKLTSCSHFTPMEADILFT